MVKMAESYAFEGDLTKNWIGWIFFGLLFSLRTIAMPFKPFRGFTQAPSKKRIPITIALAALVTGLVGIGI